MSDQLDIGLALSGGGFRATLFSLGSLWRLNELGWLRKLDIIASVSGGSILNAILASRWRSLDWASAAGGETAQNFSERISDPVRQFCTKSIDAFAGLEGLLSLTSTIAEKVEEKYAEELFGAMTLQDLPEPEKGVTPRFVFYATNLKSGVSLRMSSKYLADYRVGRIDRPAIDLAKVVAASSAFPPVLSPVIMDLAPGIWKPMEGADLFDQEKMREQLVLSDGGVYDNMGLEAIWERCGTVLVSDAGAPLQAQDTVKTDWVGQLWRVMDILTEQTRALRKRKLIEDFKEGRRQGSYWGITTRIGDYMLNDPLVKDNPHTRQLSQIRTRLNPFSEEEQGHLINWGYALTDAAMRCHVISEAPVGKLPVPDYPLN